MNECVENEGLRLLIAVFAVPPARAPVLHRLLRGDTPCRHPRLSSDVSDVSAVFIRCVLRCLRAPEALPIAPSFLTLCPSAA